MKKLILFFSFLLISGALFAGGKHHKVAVHLDDNDPARMNMVLNNVQNLYSYYEEIGDTTEVEVVAYGPGLNMLIDDQSPVKDRIMSMSETTDKLTFSACENTMNGITKKTGKKPVLIPGIKTTPSGVVRLIELQEAGFAYVRP